MTNEIENFDPSRLMDGVRDRIKATFVSLIPDDQWEKLVKGQADSFFKPHENHRSSSYYDTSNFSLVCNAVLSELAKEKVIEFMKIYQGAIWNDGQLQPNEKLLEILTAKAPEIFANVFGKMISSALSSIQSGRY